MARLIWSATIALVIILVWLDTASCQVTDLINTFEINWNQALAKEKGSRQSEFSPPETSKSNYSWVASTFGPCFGCGSKSYKELKHDCVHKLPMQLTVETYSKALTAVFRAPENDCVRRDVRMPKPASVNGCGRPCSELRLLRGPSTGCRCDHAKKLAYDVPKLVCQDNKNRTVSLSMCKFFYERNRIEYQAAVCDYKTVCTGSATWIEGNWSQCTHDKSNHQSRTVVCAVQSATAVQSAKTPVYFVMHDSMCDAEKRPPKLQSCARWTAEKKFKMCNCGTKRASRRVLCMREVPKVFGRRSRIPVAESECSWHLKPDSERPCDQNQLARGCKL